MTSQKLRRAIAHVRIVRISVNHVKAFELALHQRDSVLCTVREIITGRLVSKMIVEPQRLPKYRFVLWFLKILVDLFSVTH